MALDPVWNAPEPVDIYGRSFLVRELPAGRLRLYLREVLAILSRAAKAPDSAEAGMQVIEQYGDQLWAIIGESTGLKPSEIDELPGRVFMRLVDEVLKAQEPMVVDFSAVRHRIDGLLAHWKPQRSNGTTALRSSSASSYQSDSTPTPSSTD